MIWLALLFGLLLVMGNVSALLIALDCACNVIICTVTLQKAAAGETLSAHAWRAREKWLGRTFLPFIDWLFSWQPLDPEYLEETGAPITSHCRRAFEKARRLAYLPEEYRS